MNDTANPLPDRAPPRHTPELGLASLILGAVVFLAAPVVLLLATQVFANGAGTASDAEIRAWLARIGVTGPFLISLFGAWLGVRGLQRHRVEEGSFAMPAAGLALCTTAFIEWGVTCYALLWTVESMRR